MNDLIQKYIAGSTAVKIRESIEQAVREGRFHAGMQLPPVREVAQSLKVSPATVASAYQALQVRGILISEGRRGTRVSHRSVLQTRTLPSLPPNVRNLRDGNPDPALLPPIAEALREIDPSHRLYGEAQNDPALLAIASRDFAIDGLEGPVTVVNGAIDGLERALRENLRAGDRVALEDPGFGSIVDLVASLGMFAVPMANDDEGPRPDEVKRVLKSRVQAMILVPRAQNPTGAVVSPERAAELRTLLHASPQTLVIEDDHMHLISGAPLNSVLAPRIGRWACVRSMSKGLNPDLRLAVLTGDDETIRRVQDRFVVGERWVSHILQRLVARLLGDATVREHLSHATTTYAARRTALLEALNQRGIEAHGRSGYNVWIPVAEETPIVQDLFEAGWAISAGERFRLSSPPAIRITASTLNPADAGRVAEAFAQAVGVKAKAATPVA